VKIRQMDLSRLLGEDDEINQVTDLSNYGTFTLLSRVFTMLSVVTSSASAS